MKKFIFSAAIACLVIASCDDVNPENGVLGDISQHPMLGNTATAVLQPDEQKVKLQSVAEKLIAECPAEEFKTLATLCEDFTEKYLNDTTYNFDAIFDWAEGTDYEIYKEDYTVVYDGKKSVTTSLEEYILFLSNYKGLFTFGDQKVTVSEYDGTKAIFTVNGKKYEVTIEQNGKITTAVQTLTWHGEWNEYGYHDENGNWHETTELVEVIDDAVVCISVGVPEMLTMTITENGKHLADVTIRFTVSFTADGLSLSTDNFSTEATASINGYELIVENTKYDAATGKTSCSETLKKDGTVLISQVVSADVKLAIEKDEWNEEWGGDRYTHRSEDILVAKEVKNITAGLDILGEIQVIGTCSNALDASVSLDAFYTTVYPEEGIADDKTAQRHLDNFNAKMDFGVFYDKGNNKQADVEWEYTKEISMPEYDRNGDGVINNADSWADYDIIPVIVFNDGSRYAIEEYFTENSFGGLLDKMSDFADSYDTVFGYFTGSN